MQIKFNFKLYSYNNTIFYYSIKEKKRGRKSKEIKQKKQRGPISAYVSNVHIEHTPNPKQENSIGLIDRITFLVRRFSTNTRNSPDKRYPCHLSIAKTTIWRDRWWTKWLFVGQRHETTVLPPVVLHYRSIDEESRLRQGKVGSLFSRALFDNADISDAATKYACLSGHRSLPVSFSILHKRMPNLLIDLISFLPLEIFYLRDLVRVLNRSVYYKNNCEIFLCNIENTYNIFSRI